MLEDNVMKMRSGSLKPVEQDQTKHLAGKELK
jgi:hypothetical protein